MSFDDDNRDAPFVRPAMTIRLTDLASGDEIETMEIPARTIPHAELSPEWLALPDAEQEQNDSAEQDSTRKEQQWNQEK